MKFENRIRDLDALLHLGTSFDIVKKKFEMLGNRWACLYYIAPFSNNEILSRILSFLMSLEGDARDMEKDPEQFLQSAIPYAEFSMLLDQKQAVFEF